MTSQRLRIKVLYPLGLMLLILTGLVSFFVHKGQTAAFESEAYLTRSTVSELYELLLDQEAETLRGMTDLLVERPEFREPLKAGDGAALGRLASSLYTDFNHRYRVSHFYFINNEGVVLHRAHTPDRSGDKIDRFTFREAKRTKRTAYGVELGPLGTFTLRVVSPVEENGKIIGFIELGEEIGHIVDALRQTVNVELAVLINKKHLSRADWQSGVKAANSLAMPWEKLSGHVVTSLNQTELLNHPETFLERFLSGSSRMQELSASGRTFMSSGLPLRDASQREVGVMLVFSDVTHKVEARGRQVFLAAVACFMTSALMFLYFYHRVGAEEARVTGEHLKDSLEQQRLRLAEQQQYIAEIKDARSLVERQSEFLQLIIDTVPVPVFYKDGEARYLGCNRAFEHFLGFVREEIIGKKTSELYDRIHEANEASDAAVLAGAENVSYEAFIKDAKGQTREVLISKAPYNLGLEGGMGLVGAVFDITESKATKRKLQQSQERLRSILDNARIGIIMVDAQGRFESANQTFAAMLGYSEDELKALSLHDITYEKDKDITASVWARLASGEANSIGYEKRYRKKDGSIIHVNVSANRMADEGSGLNSFVAIVEDIGDRKRAEEDRDRLAKAVENADEAIVITDANGGILYGNPAFSRITGYEASEVVGKTPAILNSGVHDDKFYAELWATLKAGGVWRGRFVNRKKNGELFTEAATISSVRGTEGQVLYYVAVKRDVTRETELEQSLAQAQKMEAVGTLASGVSHDFNNTLQAISGFAQVLKARGRMEEKDGEYIDLILQAADRGAELVRQILTFSRQSQQERRPVDLNREITEVMKILSKTVPRNISFDIALAADLLPISATADQIDQIVMNLSTNAWDAMPEGGSISIRTLNVSGEDGNYAELVFKDTGYGMSEKTVERIYDPFFTTKPVGKGTGLGLATIYGIVKSHGGTIRCDSLPGKGTTFTLLFPALDDRRASDGKRDESRAGELRGGTETILLVDDEKSILDTTAELLSSFGYKILTAESGEAALGVYTGKADSIQLMIMDLGMPGMGGAKCLEMVLAFNPKAKVIIASGYDSKEEITQAGAKSFLNKPFRLADLLSRIRQVLDA